MKSDSISDIFFYLLIPIIMGEVHYFFYLVGWDDKRCLIWMKMKMVRWFTRQIWLIWMVVCSLNKSALAKKDVFHTEPWMQWFNAVRHFNGIGCHLQSDVLPIHFQVRKILKNPFASKTKVSIGDMIWLSKVSWHINNFKWKIETLTVVSSWNELSFVYYWLRLKSYLLVKISKRVIPSQVQEINDFIRNVLAGV